jgi:SWI/SNF-related matrix-associated actin-dependent regulator of chromatin subfamily A containing DEAD/H box 1
MRIPAVFRLLLTGTPLQNNLQELASLLAFMLPNVFHEHSEDLAYIFKHKAKTTEVNHDALLSNQRIEKAKSMLTPFVLRRSKFQVLKDIPAKTHKLVYCDATPTQRELYDSCRQDFVDNMAARAHDRATGEKTAGVQTNPLMQLRKAAIHPLLIRSNKNYPDDVIHDMAQLLCQNESDYRGADLEKTESELDWMSDFELFKLCEDYPTTLSKFSILPGGWMDSGKVETLKTLLLEYKQNGDRCLLFSQFQIVLNILEAVMESLQIDYFRLDGSTAIADRQDMIDQFYEEKDVTVFMLTTKAGGTGINLACANKVIIFDASFNPHEDLQAENRAHRVGQTREVEVVRLVTRGTVEEQIHALGQSKLALDSRVSGAEGGSKALENALEKEVAAELEKLVVAGKDKDNTSGNEKEPQGNVIANGDVDKKSADVIDT